MCTAFLIRFVLLAAMGILMTNVVAAADLPAQAQMKGIFRRQADNTYVYQSDVYRVVFNADGVMVSLQVKGREFLRPVKGEAGGAGIFINGKRVSALAVQPLMGFSALIGDGNRGLFLNTEADRIELDAGQETPNARVEYVFFPADGIVLTPVEKPVMHRGGFQPWQTVAAKATRWTAPDGTSIDLQYDAQLSHDYNGAPAMVVDDPYRARICGEIRFPASSWGALKAVVTMQGAVEDHNFPAGKPIGMSGSVTLNAPTTEALEVVLQMENLDTGEIVHAERQPLKPGTNNAANYQFEIRWDKAGPWRVNAVVVAGEHAIGRKLGTVVYDLEHYKPPLNRPADFWEFWQKALEAQRALPLDPVLMRDDKASTPEYNVYNVYITGYQGRRLFGCYREPAAPGCYPVTIGSEHGSAVPEFGSYTVYITEDKSRPKEAASCALVASMDGMATYRTGLGNRHTSNLFYNYIDILRWVDFIATCEKADLARSIYFAGSRSGPVGIAMLALDPRVKMYVANVPTNNRWDWQVTLPGAGGWGPWAHDRLPGQSQEEFTRELSYFNADNFAERVTQPCLINVGLLDELSQVTGNLACCARLVSPRKKICLRAWHGHEGPSQEWKDTYAKWRAELFQKQ